MKAPWLVLAVGNPSRGDDAFGPLLAERLHTWLAAQGPDWQAQVEVIVDLQLMVEHVFDLQGRERVLFVDAAAQGPDQPVLRAVTPDDKAAFVQSHASTPAQLLALHATLLDAPPPQAELLTFKGHGFELGQPLSAPMDAAMPQAWLAMQAWLRQGVGPCARPGADARAPSSSGPPASW